jgi:hypothetical protein
MTQPFRADALMPYEEHLVVAIEIRPFNATEFIQPHGRRNCELNDAAKRNLLPWIRIECRNEPIEFILGWSPVSLVALSDEAEPGERDAGRLMLSVETTMP